MQEIHSFGSWNDLDIADDEQMSVGMMKTPLVDMGLDDVAKTGL
jgi:hypothetical protein